MMNIEAVQILRQMREFDYLPEVCTMCTNCKSLVSKRTGKMFFLCSEGLMNEADCGCTKQAGMKGVSYGT